MTVLCFMLMSDSCGGSDEDLIGYHAVYLFDMEPEDLAKQLKDSNPEIIYNALINLCLHSSEIQESWLIDSLKEVRSYAFWQQLYSDAKPFMYSADNWLSCAAIRFCGYYSTCKEIDYLGDLSKLKRLSKSQKLEVVAQLANPDLVVPDSIYKWLRKDSSWLISTIALGIRGPDTNLLRSNDMKRNFINNTDSIQRHYVLFWLTEDEVADNNYNVDLFDMYLNANRSEKEYLQSKILQFDSERKLQWINFFNRIGDRSITEKLQKSILLSHIDSSSLVVFNDLINTNWKPDMTYDSILKTQIPFFFYAMASSLLDINRPDNSDGWKASVKAADRLLEKHSEYAKNWRLYKKKHIVPAVNDQFMSEKNKLDLAHRASLKRLFLRHGYDTSRIDSKVDDLRMSYVR